MVPTSRDPILHEVLTSVEIGEVDRARLQELGGRLAPHFVEIARRVYDRLAVHPGTAPFLRNPAQIVQLRADLVEWMALGLRGPYDARFYEQRLRNSRPHIAVKLPQHYVFTATNVLRGEYDDQIAALYEPHEARLVATSVDKLLDLELALMLHNYQLDLEAKLVAQAGAAQADRVTAIRTLSAGLAHEVRNPLNSAKLQLELLDRRLRRDHEDPKLLEPIELVHQEIARLSRLLDEFLAFARPSPLILGDHDLVAIVREVVDAERPIAKARGAVLELELGGRRSLTARVDEHQLRQIIRNLVHNAIEAVRSGGRVTVKLEVDDRHIQLIVEDNGAGIPEAVQRRLYEPFFSTKESGIGLGLSIVHSAVTLHGGTIALASSPGGTRFHVALPRGAGEAERR
jgi:two-component system, NtrC family, sensor histidine kinase HydH